MFIGLHFLLLHGALAQEALRASLAGEYALEAQKQEVANQYYNFKMGDLKLRLEAGFGVDATDNVNYSEKNKQADFSVRPQLSVTAVMPVTDKNTLALTIGAGYAMYAKTKERNHFFLTPGSEVAFNIYAGDFVFNLHNDWTYTVDEQQQSEITGGNYGYFENRTGVTTTWDLNKLLLTFSVDHEIYSPTQPQYEYQARASELLNLRAVFLLNPTTQLGLQVGASATEFDTRPSSYTNRVSAEFETIGTTTRFVGFVTNRIYAYPFLSNQKSVNFGPYFQSRLSQHLRVTLAAGYAIYFQETDSYFAKAGDKPAFYADLMVQHTVNARLGYSLNVGHQIRQGLAADTLDYYYFRLSPSWRAFDKLTIQTPISVESTTSTGGQNEKYQYWTLGLSASYQLTQKLNLTASYNYRMRDSNLAGAGYVENQLVLDTRYSF